MLISELILLFSSIILVKATRLTYPELKLIEPSCNPKDTCSTITSNLTNDLMNWHYRHCFCDHLCSEYGDCCIDSNFFKRDEENIAFNNYECVRVKQFDNIYVKVTCMDGWLDKEISDECHKASLPFFSSKFDPLRDLPVTSSKSNITYKNYFCAICNNDSFVLEFWKTQVDCGQAVRNYNDKFENVSMKYVFNNLVKKEGKYGIYLDTALNGKLEFNNCTIDPKIPPSVEDIARKCKCTLDHQYDKNCIRPITTCSPSWRNPSVERLCHSYTAIIYDNIGVTYKNIHCALCNNVAREILQCNDPKPSIVGTRFGWSDFTKPFSLLFDFFDWGGSNTVGSKCNADEVWDTAFKKCRNLICGKEIHKPKFGKCVPIDDDNSSVHTRISQSTGSSATEASESEIAGDSSTVENMNFGVIFPDD